MNHKIQTTVKEVGLVLMRLLPRKNKKWLNQAMGDIKSHRTQTMTIAVFKRQLRELE